MTSHLKLDRNNLEFRFPDHHQGTTPISVTIRGRKLAFQRACTIAGIRH
jgi:hypothetical protein